ncbi:MAG TPA: bifunctional 2-C-methyl-D-erythritol 4-phosphate cytidylyltransferase/2-C-methyl-D-erythritol 2,4-cyclodiphosphate synthase [Kiloniellales bacterium]|nr:bifunctional 2-C-methyl-D-erythritol 4-phosphate cytidylyltransferase/2-C-methyl-D-erythritol 2,4-cyclodiphosphate synthase [Kiloniellales bacterium]
MTQMIALVVAAGRGLRFGTQKPKQYSALAGIPLLRHSLLRLARHPAIDGIRVVIHPDDLADYEAATADLPLLPPVEGGKSRQESVRRGLESLVSLQPGRVLIHDGARPFPSAALLDRLVSALEEHPGAVPALPIVDTLKRAGAEGSPLQAGPERGGLLRVQTPQAFHFAAILAAHRANPAGEESDDAAVAEKAGLPVIWIAGEEENFKVTTSDDHARAEAFLARPHRIRTGLGYDVHAFAEGDHVMLCGLRIPHDQGLQGHSDADAGLHALTDALLGSIAAGDIGQHFPPSDPRWKGADSAAFLVHAAKLVRDAGGTLEHVDITLICESPKLGPHREAMRARLCELLSLQPDQVSIKATTTEGLGFTGRGEGIAAQALATVALAR